MMSADLLTFTLFSIEHRTGVDVLRGLGRPDLIDLVGIDDIAPDDICTALNLKCSICREAIYNFKNCAHCQGEIEEPTPHKVRRYKDAFSIDSAGC